MTAPAPWRNPRLAGRIPELDGIRGLAILLVIVWHYFVSSAPNVKPHTDVYYVLSAFRLAWSGVDLFFVLSGFLIVGILYDARTRGSYFLTFYARRFYRILPLYSVVLALFLIGLALRPNFPSPNYQAIFNRTLPLWPYFPFLQNFAMAWSQTLGPTWLSITWSLAIEEQFYILLPLAIRFLDRRAIIALSLLAIAGAPLCRLGSRCREIPLSALTCFCLAGRTRLRGGFY